MLFKLVAAVAIFLSGQHAYNFFTAVKRHEEFTQKVGFLLENRKDSALTIKAKILKVAQDLQIALRPEQLRVEVFPFKATQGPGSIRVWRRPVTAQGFYIADIGLSDKRFRFKLAGNVVMQSQVTNRHWQGQLPARARQLSSYGTSQE